jgi:hypothetical protein
VRATLDRPLRGRPLCYVGTEMASPGGLPRNWDVRRSVRILEAGDADGKPVFNGLDATTDALTRPATPCTPRPRWAPAAPRRASASGSLGPLRRVQPDRDACLQDPGRSRSSTGERSGSPRLMVEWVCKREGLALTVLWKGMPHHESERARGRCVCSVGWRSLLLPRSETELAWEQVPKSVPARGAGKRSCTASPASTEERPMVLEETPGKLSPRGLLDGGHQPGGAQTRDLHGEDRPGRAKLRKQHANRGAQGAAAPARGRRGIHLYPKYHEACRTFCKIFETMTGRPFRVHRRDPMNCYQIRALSELHEASEDQRRQNREAGMQRSAATPGTCRAITSCRCSRAGPTDPSNIQALCAACHAQKSGLERQSTVCDPCVLRSRFNRETHRLFHLSPKVPAAGRDRCTSTTERGPGRWT